MTMDFESHALYADSRCMDHFCNLHILYVQVPHAHFIIFFFFCTSVIPQDVNTGPTLAILVVCTVCMFLFFQDDLFHSKISSILGLCDMDKKYISRFFYFFFDFDFNHDFDTNRHALSHILLVFAHLTCLAHLVLHFSLFYYTFYSLFLVFTYIYIYIYICSCVVLLLYNFYSLHCPLSGPDLIYISLLIIPCIIYYVTNKETLTFTVINAFCVNLKHISKGNQLDLSQKVVTCL